MTRTSIHFINRISGIGLGYILAVSLVAILLQNTAPSIWHSLCQICMTLEILWILHFVSVAPINRRALFGLIFSAYLIFSFQIGWLNVSLYNSQLGKFAADALFYERLAITYSEIGYLELFEYLGKNGWAVDDYGFPALQTMVFSLVGVNYGLIAMQFVNALAVASGGVLLAKIVNSFTRDYKLSILAGALWGILPFGAYVGTVGLKENIFALFVLIALYGLFIWNLEGAKYKSRLFFITGIFGVALFRLPLVYMLLLSLVANYLLKSKMVVRNIVPLVFLIILIGYILFDSVVSYSYAQKGYNDANKILQGVQDKLQGTGNLFIANITNLISAVIGPFPSLHSSSSQKISYITLHSFTEVVKCYFSFFFVYAIYRIVKDKVIALFPFLIFIALHIFTLVITFYTMDERFHWPHMPIYVLFTFWGMFMYLQRTPSRPNYLALYTLFVSLMIMIFNFR